MATNNKFKLNYKDIFDTLPDGYIFLDNERVIKDMNQSAEIILNVSRKKLHGKNLNNLFPHEISELVDKAETDERTITDDDIKLRVFFNQPLSLQVIVTPYINENAALDGFILQLRNIEGTKLLAEQNEIQLFNNNFENMILGLTHELKNPLSSVKGAAQLLNDDLNKDEMKKCSQIIINEVDRLSELIDRIKRLDDFDTENFLNVDINEILLDIIFLQSKLLKDRIKIVKDLDVSIPPVIGDPNSLKQVFINLVKNAVQSISDKGKITIRTKLINDYKIKSNYPILISIKDTGKGISPDQKDKIFTPFYTTKDDGTGVGLFVTYQILVKHGGTIVVESEENLGSEFKVYLPVHPGF